MSSKECNVVKYVCIYTLMDRIKLHVHSNLYKTTHKQETNTIKYEHIRQHMFLFEIATHEYSHCTCNAY